MKTRGCFRLRVEELERRFVPSTLAYSTNWSGYAVSTGAGPVTQVAGSWKVPAVSSSVSGYSSAWVGIDGWSSSTVEQIGTDSDYINGRAYYYAWYEMYPAGSVNLSLAVNAGDTISASVSYIGSGQFTLSITDVTTGGSFSTTKTSSQAQLSSAEWIQEAPSSFSGVLPLSNFGTINFSGANATVSGTAGPADNAWSGSTLYQVNMVTNTGASKATTSALSDSGSPSTSSFSVSWVSSGASTKGHGHNRSINVPANSSPTVALSSSAVAALAANSQATPPAAVVTQPLPVTVAPPAAIASALTASNAARTSAAPFVVDFAYPEKEAADQAIAPESSQPSESALPMDNGAPPQTEGLPAPQAEQAPANPPGASPETDQATDVSDMDSLWLPGLLEDTRVTLDGGRAGKDLAMAGLVLFFALDHTRASATEKQAEDRDGGRGRFGRNRRDRHVLA